MKLTKKEIITIISCNNKIISSDTLKMSLLFLKEKIPSNISTKQQEMIKNIFINNNFVIDENTPNFIKEDNNCIKHSIKTDIKSIKYIKLINEEIKKYTIEQALNQKFILKSDSNDFLKSNYDIAMRSIKLDSFSANYINWDSFNNEETYKLTNEIINIRRYILSNDSPYILANNPKIVLNSIKKDLESLKYASRRSKTDYEVFKYAIEHDSKYIKDEIEEKPLKYFVESNVLNNSLKSILKYDTDNPIYIERINKIYNDIIKNPPTISKITEIFSIVIEEEWNKHRQDHTNYYDNIFGKICAQLRNYEDFETALKNMHFQSEMVETLDKKYKLLYEAMTEYHSIYHSNIPKKLELLQTSKNIISKLSALYVAKTKENYKKEKYDQYYDGLKNYFEVRTEENYINKKLVQYRKKDKFIRMYQSGNSVIKEIIRKIVNKYILKYDEKTVWRLINKFIYDTPRLNKILETPDSYIYYEKYEESLKLIKRLNLGNIKYSSPELEKYRDVIIYDNIKNQYIYIGRKFTNYEISECENHKKITEIYKKLNKEIMNAINGIEYDGKIEERYLYHLKKELPFNDKYFKFNIDEILDELSLEYFIKYIATLNLGHNKDSIIDDEAYNNIYKLLVNDNIGWLLVFKNIQPSITVNYELSKYGIDKENIEILIANMKYLVKLSKDLDYDLTDIKSLLSLSEIYDFTIPISFAILDSKIIEMLCKNTNNTSKDKELIITKATELIAQMAKRNTSTVPYVNGKTIDYTYSLYDSHDESVLISGIMTDSCFKVDSADNDFFQYCCLDKNGFVIKITDNYNNFIGKASGFRNGNCIFINQLRTIADESGNCYTGIYQNEASEIIETLKKACLDFVKISQENDEETDKIEYVFITHSYIMEHYNPNVDDEITYDIGDKPMDTESEDWKEFITNTKYLSESIESNYFQTDYGGYDLICLAAFNEDTKEVKIKRKNVKAVYKRPRNKIINTNKIDEKLIHKINKIKGIKAYLNNQEFEAINIKTESIVITGDNWYIIYNDNNIIDSCLLEFDNDAKKEYEAIITVLQENKLENINKTIKVLESSSDINSKKLARK